MTNPVSRTADFLAALSKHHGRPPKAAALLKPSLPATPHEFTQLASALTTRIEEMRVFVRGCQRRYADYSARGMQDAERDEIDAAVAEFLRAAMAQIELLKTDAVAAAQRERGGSFPAHRLGVVVILNEELQEVSRLSERLRGVRIERAIAEKGRVEVAYDEGVARDMAEERRRRERKDGEGEGEGEEWGDMEMEFARENAALVGELVETREQVREAERTVFEIANLNHVFATKVLEQAREIEVLYDLAVEATGYMERGNTELKKMRQRGPVVKYALAGLALLLAFALLFLEWMGRRRSLFFL